MTERDRLMIGERNKQRGKMDRQDKSDRQREKTDTEREGEDRQTGRGCNVIANDVPCAVITPLMSLRASNIDCARHKV